MVKRNRGPVAVGMRYVEVKARGYSREFENFVCREFKHFGFKSDGSGYDFTYQDVGGGAPDEETAKAARDYFRLFPGVKAAVHMYFDWEGDQLKKYSTHK
jgi:hypothetical protein